MKPSLATSATMLAVVPLLLSTCGVHGQDTANVICNPYKFDDGSKFASYLNQVKDSLKSSFQGGVLFKQAPEEGDPVMYGSVSCSFQVSTDCNQYCLREGLNEMEAACGNAYGAQYVRDVCKVQYEAFHIPGIS